MRIYELVTQLFVNSPDAFCMDFDKIISDLKNKVYHPVYFLMGEESFFIDEVSNFIEKNVLQESEREFNQTILYGAETNVPDVLSEAKSFPMMSNYRVVLIKEAQNLKSLIPTSTAKKDTSEEKRNLLEEYLKNPQKSTILVFCYKYKTVDMRTAFSKTLSKYAVVLKFDTLYDNKVPRWVEGYIAQQGYSIEPSASMLLTEFLGNNLGKIAGELQKLFINIPAKTKITAEHIQNYIGISKEYNNFELQDALGKRNVLKANRIIQYFASNPKDNPMVVTVSSLVSYFSKLLMYHALPDKSQNNVAAALKVNPFFVKDYTSAAQNFSLGKIAQVLSILRTYDLKSKGFENTGVEEGELLKEMIFKIIH